MSSEFYLTGDAYAAAYLWLHKQSFRGTTINERNRIFFRFAHSNQIHDLMLDFANGAAVDVKRFAEAHKFFVDQIRQARSSNEGAR